MLCHRCGTPLKNNARFCSNCGASLEEEAVQLSAGSQPAAREKSGNGYYAPAELDGLTTEALTVAYAEIGARHGEVPTDPQLRAYFECLSWYGSTGGSGERNSYEEQNLFLIGVCLRKLVCTYHHVGGF